MTLSDAVLVLLLAECIHGTNDAVRRAGKNIVKKLPRASVTSFVCDDMP